MNPAKPFHNFRVGLKPHGLNSRVWMDGSELKGVKEVQIAQQATGYPVVTITFIAASVNGEDRDA